MNYRDPADWQKERDALMELIMTKTRLCPFGYGNGAGKFGDRYERTSCSLGSPGCACDDEVFLIEERRLLGEPPCG